MQSLGITQYPHDLHEIYDTSLRDFEYNGDEIALGKKQSEYIEKYNMFEKWRDELCETAKAVRSDEYLLRFLYLLKYVMADSALAAKVLPEITIPRRFENTMINDLSPIFSMFEFLPRIEGEMKRRGVSESIIADTFSEFEGKAEDFYARHGYLGISTYFLWLQRFINFKIIRVGRFNFEMRTYDAPVEVFESDRGEHLVLINNRRIHRSGQILGSAGCEDEEGSFLAELIEDSDGWTGYPAGPDALVKNAPVKLSKNEWRRVLKNGDPVLSVHIPSQMSLAQEVCEESYIKAKKVFKDHYPEFDYKAFMCHSWMMDPQLKALLGRETNLTLFMDKYIPYPLKSNGLGVINFVFLLPEDTPPEKLPEDTSLRRAIKEHYLKGKYIYVQGGVFFDA